MDILVIIWIVVFIGGRILTSVARKEQRQRYQQTTPISNEELEVGPKTTRQKAKSERQLQPQQRNAAAQQKRNDSARLRQEMARQLKSQAERGQRVGSVKDYIDRMSGSQFEQPTSSNEVAASSRREVLEKEAYTMSSGIYEEIDWDNYEADFMADSEWEEDDPEEDMIQTVRNTVAIDTYSTPSTTKPAHQHRDLLRSDGLRKAIIITEILGKPKSLRKP